MSKNTSVKQFTAWNEPNFKENATHKSATKAAMYWRRAQALCNKNKRCADVPAGEFAGGVGKPSYIESYRFRLMKGLSESQKPRIWSFHAYGDGIDGAIFGRIRQPSNTVGWRKRYALTRYERGNNKPKVWNTEQSAFYRVICEKLSPAQRANNCGKVNAQGQPDANGTESTALRVGARNQARAGAMLVREAIKPVSGATPVSRFYYYELQSTVGFQYYPFGGGQSGRRSSNGALRCNEMDAGLLGSDVDGPAVPTDKVTRSRPGATTTNPNARRPLWCLFRVRRATDVRNRSVRPCS